MRSSGGRGRCVARVTTGAARPRAQDVRRQMYTADDDRVFFDWIQRELRAVVKRLEDGRACLAHLELALVNVACDDPGAAVGAQLALPLLQERLDGRARAHAAQRAAAAQDAIIRAEARPPRQPRTAAAAERAATLRRACGVCPAAGLVSGLMQSWASAALPYAYPTPT